MSKNALYLVVAIALAATAVTFFISAHNPKQTCLASDVPGGAGGLPVQLDDASREPPALTQATVRGLPLWYYQEPLPLNCVPDNNVSSPSGLNMNHLGTDFLIWLLASLAVMLGIAGFEAWRGPRMLGDKR